MSLILDALRKSEHQRQREAGPALAVVPETQPVQRSLRWMPALVALLALNVLVLALVLLREPAPEPADPAPAAAAPERPAPARPTPAATAGPARSAFGGDADNSSTTRSAVELPARPPTTEVRPLTTELPTTPARPAAGPGAAATQPAQRPAGAPAAAAAAPASSARAEADAQLPRFADLVVRGELNVPHMHLDIHVYAGDPAQRFVFINMKRYNEGEATAEGPRVERIVPGGVVMDHRGQRFLLTRD